MTGFKLTTQHAGMLQVWTKRHTTPGKGLVKGYCVISLLNVGSAIER